MRSVYTSHTLTWHLRKLCVCLDSLTLSFGRLACTTVAMVAEMCFTKGYICRVQTLIDLSTGGRCVHWFPMSPRRGQIPILDTGRLMQACHRYYHCTALHCTALHCTALHCTALHCTALHCTALHCTALHCTALHCTVLNYAAMSHLHCTLIFHQCSISTLHCCTLNCMSALPCTITTLHYCTIHCTSAQACSIATLHWRIIAIWAGQATGQDTLPHTWQRTNRSQ